jgi:nucleotide-binding universal stress UspA family protein
MQTLPLLPRWAKPFPSRLAGGRWAGNNLCSRAGFGAANPMTGDTMKVLVATDGTDTAIDAAQIALGLLREGVEIVLVTVIQDYEDPMDSAGGFEGPLITAEEAEQEYQRQQTNGQAALERTRAALGQDVEVCLVPTEADPGHAIIDIANSLHPDLIVLGSAEKGFFLRLLGGSVSEYVVRHAACPVLVVPHRPA